MGISVRARRAGLCFVGIAGIAASCALPGYEVGESSATSTTTTTSGGGSGMSSTVTSGSTGTGGNGQGGDGGGVNSQDAGTMAMCPASPPSNPSTPCEEAGQICRYPSAVQLESCCNDVFTCAQSPSDPMKLEWIPEQPDCPPDPCSHNCSPTCQDKQPMDGCRCRPAISKTDCIYNTCEGGGAPATVLQCTPKNGDAFWKTVGQPQCCTAAEQNKPCPGGVGTCTLKEDAHQMQIFICE
jgi:hypothetical protein